MITQLEISLLNGLRPERVEYRYQPLYNTGTRQVDKVEVHLRVQDGMGGYFDTEELVAAAEDMGLMGDMNRQTVIHMCGILPDCRKRGISGLSINLSPATCHAACLVPEVNSIMTAAGANMPDICLEITEMATLIDEQSFVKTMWTLYSTEWESPEDDVSSGSAHLQCVGNMPFEILKLDKSLVWAMERDSVVRTLLERMVHFAREHGCTVIAEGVETAVQAQILEEMGCHYLKGCYYGKAMQLNELFAMAEAYRGRSWCDQLA